MSTIATNNSSSANNAITDLISKVMDKYDTNNDKKLNADEFGSFLSGLLGGARNTSFAATADDVEQTASIDRPQAPFNPPAANWTLMHGFSPTNYYDSSMNTMKYQFARIAADYDPKQPGALEKVFNDPRFKAAFPNAQLVGHDGIDFGGQLSEGNGSGVPVYRVDVGETFLENRSGTAWQWLDLVNG